LGREGRLPTVAGRPRGRGRADRPRRRCPGRAPQRSPDRRPRRPLAPGRTALRGLPRAGARAGGAGGASAAPRPAARRARPRCRAAPRDGAPDAPPLDAPCRAEDPDCAYDEAVPAVGAGAAAAASADAADAAAPPAPPLDPLPPLPGTQLSFASYDSGLTSEVTRCDSGDYHVRVTGPPGAALVLHWGVDNWGLPPGACIPEGSEQAGDRAVRTAFAPAAGATGVTLRFPEAVCPERLVFVVHDTAGDVWIRDHSANFSLPLRCGRGGVLGSWCWQWGRARGRDRGVVSAVGPRRRRGRRRACGRAVGTTLLSPTHPATPRAPCLGTLVEGVLIAESSYEHWGLLHRLQRVMELLDAAEATGAGAWRERPAGCGGLASGRC
jgi:hypothetical protein